MKLLLESWRKYVTEELLNEVPLADFGYDDYEYPATDDRKRGPSVGYEKSKDPGYKEKAIKFFDKTKDLWYIVFLKTTLWAQQVLRRSKQAIKMVYLKEFNKCK